MIEDLIGKSFISYDLSQKSVSSSAGALKSLASIHYVWMSWAEDVTEEFRLDINSHKIMSAKVLLKILIFSVWLQGLAFGSSQSDKVVWMWSKFLLYYFIILVNGWRDLFATCMLRMMIWSIVIDLRDWLGTYQPKMIRPCDWTFQTKVIIVYDSLFRKSISIVYCLPLL